MSKLHSNQQDCCHTVDPNALCERCKADYEDYLDATVMSSHDEQLQAMDDFLTKLELEGIFYGNKKQVG